MKAAKNGEPFTAKNSNQKGGALMGFRCPNCGEYLSIWDFSDKEWEAAKVYGYVECPECGYLIDFDEVTP